MIDDQAAMDKKPGTRCSLQGAKGGSAETKFKQDALTKFSRGPRRRESPSQRPEPPKKSNPQKVKTAIDKRPRPRATINFGDRSEVVEDEILEASATKPKFGSRKVNLNHLLNFTFAKKESSDHPGSHRGHRLKTNLPKFNKEQFLQANCQFVVLEGGDYSIHSADPDTLVDWNLIQELRLPCHEVPSCPICLYPATAAKITRCGHIYCWTCILHYLSLSPRSWSKCPICYEAVHQDDLKSVVSMARPAPKVGDDIQLTLMKRERGSLFVVPVTQAKGSVKPPLRICDGPITCFQKLLIASQEDALVVLQRERNELQLQLSDDNPEQCFVESAINLLQKRQDDLMKLSSACTYVESRMFDKPVNSSDEENQNISLDEDVMATVAELHVEEKVEQYTELETIFTDEEQSCCSHSEEDNQSRTYYFYQASDGQQIYMHSINARMLIKEYGSLRDCPPEVTANIVELEAVTMTDALRKRLRYLQHLPLTCVFQVAELQLKFPLVSQTTLKCFNAEVQKRHRARSRKAREEHRRDRYIELEQNKKFGKFPSARYSLSSFKQFPVCNSVSTDEDPPLTPDEVRSPSPASVSTGDLDQEDNTSTNSLECKPTSFAQMLRDGKARSNRPVTVDQGTSASTATSVALNSDGEEEYAPAPDFHVAFSDALQAALSNINLCNNDIPGEKKTGKRKKSKKTLLFTTSVSRSK